MKHRTARRPVLGTALVALGFAALGGFPACGARSPLPLFGSLECTPGATESCTGADGCEGTKTCLGSWSFGECSCADAAAIPCFQRTFQARASRVSLRFEVDRSGSMYVFWPAVSEALRRFFAEPESAGLVVALDFFPSVVGDEEAACHVESYAEADVPYGELVAADGIDDPHEALLFTTIDTTSPNGGTPMQPAYQGALETARSESARTGDEAVVVLVTDGVPQGCTTSNTSLRLRLLAEDALAGSPSVRTFTIGLDGADETLVREIADLGGGESFFIDEGGVEDALLASLDRIRHRLACDYDIAGAPGIVAEDVTVTFTSGTGTSSSLPFDPGCTKGGWRLDDTEGSPRVSLCPDVCNTVRSDERGELEIRARCAAVGPSGSGGAGGSGGKDGGAAVVNDVLGARCETDADCGTGLFCLTERAAMLGGVGPSSGLCTASCTAHDDCRRIDGESRCEVVGSGRFCVEKCVPGPRNLRDFDPDKCHGRPELVCSPFGEDPAKTVCLPLCAADVDCRNGRFCHPADGLCHDEPAAGLPLGAPCTDAGEPCAGVCRDGFCRAWCTNGTTAMCGWNGPGTGLPDGLCILPVIEIASRGGPGIGDLDTCVQLCDAEGECRTGERCYEFGIQSFADVTGRAGLCGIYLGYGPPPDPSPPE